MAPNHRVEQALKFLEAIFGDKDESLNVVLFLLPEKESASFVNIEEAAMYATEQKTNVYVHVGLTSQTFRSHNRCKAEDIEALPALWADVDVAGGLHKKKNLPPTEAAAQAILKEFPMLPTLVLHSGGGLQAWWRFEEHLTISSDQERQEAASLTRRFNSTLRNIASRRGWSLDSTHDLARLMRLPGTYNYKDPKKKRPVRLLSVDAQRQYNPSDIEEYLSQDEGPKSSTPHVKDMAGNIAGKIRLHANAQPDFDKFQALLSADERAQRTWDRNRKDLESASEYDLAMANLCVMAGWEEQEVADLLIAMRRKHGSDLKLRDDYYGLTIAKARESFKEETDTELAYEAVEQVLRGEEPQIPPLDALNQILGSSIADIEKLVQETTEYRITLKDTRSARFKAWHIQRLTSFELRYFELADVWIQMKRGNRWWSIRKLIADHISRPEKQIDLGPEAWEAGAIVEWVEQYLSAWPPSAALDERTLERDLPFQDESGVYIRLNHFRSYLDRRLSIRIPASGMPKHLRSAGLERCTKSVSQGSSSRSYWFMRARNVAK